MLESESVRELKESFELVLRADNLWVFGSSLFDIYFPQKTFQI